MTTIPGTSFPLTVYRRTGRPPLLNAAEAAQRRGLLAKIHIAKSQMGLNDGEYEMVLRSFRVGTAADLTIPQLEQMVTLLKHYGWRPVRKIRRNVRPSDDPDRLDALRRRCIEVAESIGHGWEKRLAGLSQMICGTGNLSWCRDAAKLARLLAVLGKIKEQECPGR